MFRDDTAQVLCSTDPFLFLPPHLVANYRTRNLKTSGIWPLKTEWISSFSTDGLKTLKKNVRNQIFVRNCLCQEGGKEEQRGKKRGNPISLPVQEETGQEYDPERHRSFMENSQIQRGLVTGQGNSSQSFLLLF